MKKSTITVYLAILVIIGSQFNYIILSIITSASRYRVSSVSMSPEFFIGLLFISVTTFLNLKLFFRVMFSSRTIISTVLLFLCFIFVVFSIFYSYGNLRGIITILSIFLYYVVANVVASYYLETLMDKIKFLWLIISPLFLVSLVYFYSQGRVYFSQISRYALVQPQIQGGIRSSELSIFIGLQILYIAYCFYSAHSRKERNSILFIGILLFILFFSLISLAAFGAMALVLLIYFIFVAKHRFRVIAIVLFLIVLLIGAFQEVTLSAYNLSSGLISMKINGVFNSDGSNELFNPEGARGSIYSNLLSLIVKNPLWGVGWGNSLSYADVDAAGIPKHSHNNILGFTADNGLLAGFFYVAFVVFVLVKGLALLIKMKARSADDPKAKNVQFFLFVAVSCFTYLQFKGLFQDTWQLKEGYLWAGIIMGIDNWIHSKTRVAVSPKQSSHSRWHSQLSRSKEIAGSHDMN